MFESIIFLAGIWLFIEGLTRRGALFYALSSVLFIISATSGVQTVTEHLVVNGTIQTVTNTVVNQPIVYASWGFVMLSLVMLIIGLFKSY